MYIKWEGRVQSNKFAENVPGTEVTWEQYLHLNKKGKETEGINQEHILHHTPVEHIEKSLSILWKDACQKIGRTQYCLIRGKKSLGIFLRYLEKTNRNQDQSERLNRQEIQN